MSCPVHGPFSTCRCGYARKSSWALLCLVLGACSAGAPEPCSASDVAGLADEAQCLARVGKMCAGVPANEPCPFEDECVARAKERCK
jgi:hypothetical protein